jgi:hypothetical protein
MAETAQGLMQISAPSVAIRETGEELRGDTD